MAKFKYGKSVIENADFNHYHDPFIIFWMKTAIILLSLIILCRCESCQKDSDCHGLNKCEDKKCTHKDLLPVADIEIGGTILLVLASALSNASGVGGGALNVLMCLVFFGFDTQSAVPLSQIIVFGGSLTTVIIQIPSRHPTKIRPLINYEMIMFILSPMLLGGTLGVILNKGFPSYIILSLLTILLVFLCYNSIQKFIRLYKKEKLQREILPGKPNQIQTREFYQSPEDNANNDNQDVKEEKTPNSQHSLVSEEAKIDPELQKLYHQEEKIILYKEFAAILFIFICAILGSLMKGGKGFTSILGFSQCSKWYWIYIALFATFLLTLGGVAEYLAIRKIHKKIELNYDFDSNDIKWNKKNATLVSFVTMFSGLIASLLGLGGGVIMNPILLNLGIRPEVSTASSSFIVCFTSLVSIFQYIISGQINYSYGIWMFVSAVSGSSIGTFLILKTVQKYKRVSFIILLLAITMIVSLVGIPLYGILNAVDQIENGSMKYGFNAFC